MENCKRIEIQLPEALIQHIQSFMSGKEAARTTLLSHSWHSAWLTRPTLVLDQRDFKNRHHHEFAEVATKAIQRYKGSNMKIESFTLLTKSSRKGIDHLAEKLILDAMEIGATELNFEFRPSTFILPPQVLRSQTLTRLSVKGCEIDGDVSCSNLKSLRLDRVRLRNRDMPLLRDLISCCVLIEELSLLNSHESIYTTDLSLIGMNLYHLHKLRRLYLEYVEVHSSFFNDDFDSRFPCLKDLTLVRCHGYRDIKMASTSVNCIRIVQSKIFRAEFRVPNLAYFSYSGVGIPSISIEAREWESHISIKCYRSHTSSWYLKLQKLLIQLRSSRINLSLNILVCRRWCAVDELEDIRGVDEPVVVENLNIEASFGLGLDLLIGSLWICRPKFVTLYWLPKSCNFWDGNNESLNEIWETLMKEVTAPDCGVPDQDIFGRFGLKRVTVEVYEEIVGEWRPVLMKGPIHALTAPPNKRKVCFRLQW